MKRQESRHFTEEELLMHLLGEETADMAREIARHIEECDECEAVFLEYGDVVGHIQEWTVPELSEDSWRVQKAFLMERFRAEFAGGRHRRILGSVWRVLPAAWNYALEYPLPTLGYIAAAVAFTLERTIATFRLDHILPRANQVFEILSQLF